MFFCITAGCVLVNIEEGGQGGFLLEDSTATYRSLDTYISIYLATLRGIDIRQVSIVKRGRSWEIGES